MKGIKAASLAIALALAAGPLLAGDRVATQGTDTVRLKDGPCAFNSVLERIKQTGDREIQGSEWKAASATLGGKSYEVCWRDVGGVAHLVYEDGDQGLIPESDLKAEITI